MDKNEANVKMTLYWTACIASIFIICSLIWANVSMHTSDNEVKTVQITNNKGVK